MVNEYQKGEKVEEGKTKIIWENVMNPKTLIMEFKDSITAGDGEKKDEIPGKGLIDWQTNCNIMGLLKSHGIPVAYISSPEPHLVLVPKMDKILKLEIVSRRISAGSITKRGFEEGHVFNPPMMEIFYKDDFLHDPKLDPEFLSYLGKQKKGFNLFNIIAALKFDQFMVLEQAFAQFGCQYIDDKIEVGLVLPNGVWDDKAEIYIIDEITAGSFRLWPYADGVQSIDFSQIHNAMPFLNKSGMLDKQVYREGADLNVVKDKFAQIAAITDKFGDLSIKI